MENSTVIVDKEILGQMLNMIDDFTHYYAPELCDDNEVAQSIKRVWSHSGMLTYLSHNRQTIKNLLNKKELA